MSTQNNRPEDASHERTIEITYEGSMAHIALAAIGAKIIEAVYGQAEQIAMLEQQLNQQALQMQFGQQVPQLQQSQAPQVQHQLNGRKTHARS